MSLFDIIFGARKKSSAATAKERLTFIIAHEHADDNSSVRDFLPALQKDLVAVISKYVQIDPDSIKVQLDKRDNMEVLEVNIVLPEVVR